MPRVVRKFPPPWASTSFGRRSRSFMCHSSWIWVPFALKGWNQRTSAFKGRVRTGSESAKSSRLLTFVATPLTGVPRDGTLAQRQRSGVSASETASRTPSMSSMYTSFRVFGFGNDMPASAWILNSDGVVVRTPGKASAKRVRNEGLKRQSVLRSVIRVREGSSPRRGRRSCAPLLSYRNAPPALRSRPSSRKALPMSVLLACANNGA